MGAERAAAFLYYKHNRFFSGVQALFTLFSGAFTQGCQSFSAVFVGSAQRGALCAAGDTKKPRAGQDGLECTPGGTPSVIACGDASFPKRTAELPQSKPDGFASSLGEGASGAPGNFALEPGTLPLCQRPHLRGGCRAQRDWGSFLGSA